MKSSIFTGLLLALLVTPQLSSAQTADVAAPAPVDSTSVEALHIALQQLRAELAQLRKESGSQVDEPIAPKTPSSRSVLEEELESLFEEIGEDLEAAGHHLAIELNQLLESIEALDADSMHVNISSRVNHKGSSSAVEELDIILEVRAKEEAAAPMVSPDAGVKKD